jgi:hypothetical protein
MNPNPDGGSGGRKETDADYFARRAEEQLRMAAASRVETVARIHQLLAQKYAALAERERGRSPAWPVVDAPPTPPPAIPTRASPDNNVGPDGTGPPPKS